MNKLCNGRIILTSRGLNSSIGQKLIGKKLRQIWKELNEKKIFLVIPPSYGEGIVEIVIKACTDLGFLRENIFINEMIGNPDVIYVGEGNTPEILDFMCKNLFCTYIQNKMNDNCVYIGSSAGVMIAGQDIQLSLDFDQNFVGMVDFTSLGLYEGIVIPHYTREQFNRYIENSDRRIISKYKSIRPIADEQVIVL